VKFRLESGWRVEAAELIDALPIFEDVPVDVLNELAGRVQLRTLGLGQPVFRQGDRATSFYVVRSGSVEVLDEDPETGNERQLRTMGRGESFGELGLVGNAPRAATVRALEESEVFEIDKGTFDRLLADMVQLPDFAPTLQSLTELRELPCFAHLSNAQIADLLDHGKWSTLTPGEVVIRQSEVGDAFYAISSGQVDVLRDGALVDTLGPRSYFGEVALLTDVPRTASVVARTPVRVFRLNRDGFEQLVSGVFREGGLVPNLPVSETLAH
jgi:cAMP-dependent protein kinase regulator